MTSVSEAKIEILSDPEAWVLRVADWILELAIAKVGVFSICLSGAATPEPVYAHLAGLAYRDKFPCSRAHWFWGDERLVPLDDALSNCQMAREVVLSRAPIPANNIHSISNQSLSATAAAVAYERLLKEFYGAESFDPARPLFDVTLLGLVSDGHTASPFRGSGVLTERDRWVAAVSGIKPEVRITLTYPALESRRQAEFLVTGSDKREILDLLLRDDDALPVAHLHPIGKLFCLYRCCSGEGDPVTPLSVPLHTRAQ